MIYWKELTEEIYVVPADKRAVTELQVKPATPTAMIG